MVWYQVLLTAGALVTSVTSVYYSIRHRRQQDPVRKGLYAARMNISMGLLLLLLAATQALLFKMSTLRLVLTTVFALLGLFNLFAGWKNRSYFLSQLQPKQ